MHSAVRSKTCRKLASCRASETSRRSAAARAGPGRAHPRRFGFAVRRKCFAPRKFEADAMRERKEFHVVPVESVSADREPQSTLPVTPQQREVWVESQMGDDASCAYNQCFVLHLRGPLSLASMQSALDQVIARHAALRTSFDKSGDKQRILPVARRHHHFRGSGARSTWRSSKLHSSASSIANRPKRSTSRPIRYCGRKCSAFPQTFIASS